MRNFLARIDINRSGARICEPLVVIESDDWGSQRMPSKEAYDALMKKGVSVDKSAYLRYDGLETSKDLTDLLEVLQKHRGSDGKPAVFTANMVMGNPDYEQIRNGDYQNYVRVDLQKTFEQTAGCEYMLTLVKQGMDAGLWMPQFHGREHLQVKRWMEALQGRKEPFFTAFQEGVAGLSNDIIPGDSVQAAFDRCDTEATMDIIIEGLDDFERIFGFRSETLIANNYIWSDDLNQGLLAAGVRHFQGMKYQLLPRKASQEKREKIRRKTGEVNALGQTYGVRNCHFEPTERGHTVHGVLKEISSAFFWKKPAIICTHRINYTGRLDENRRRQNLKELDRLLREIRLRWPKVRFISTVELANVLKNDA